VKSININIYSFSWSLCPFSEYEYLYTIDTDFDTIRIPYVYTDMNTILRFNSLYVYMTSLTSLF